MSSKHKNQVIQCKDISQFRKLVEEYTHYIGRDINADEAKLEVTVLALPRNYKRKSVRESKLRRQRQSRDTGYAIPSEDDYASYEDKY